MKKLYYNGDILTMENSDYEAVYVEDGIIRKCGNYSEIKNLVCADTEFIDLQGRCLMPAFIDCHSHLATYAKTLKLVDLSKASSIDEIIKSLKTYLLKTSLEADEMLIGFGYDHNHLIEKRHPRANDLNKVANHPIMIAHISGHMGVLNTAAMQLLKIDDNIIDPDGGKYGRDNGHLNGYLEEQAFFQINNCGEQNNDILKNQIIEALKIYASYGITTVQEGFMKKTEFDLLQKLANEKKLFLDVIGYVDLKDNQRLYQNNQIYHDYYNHFKLGGYKLFLDGSPQAKTAWLSKPYKNSGDFHGYPIYQDKQVKYYINLALNDNAQILVHCNGDGAAQQLLSAYDRETTTRPVMIHSQLLRPNQLPQLKKIGMIPSFFIAHVYYWGDVHQQNLGRRANYISCVHSALKLDIPYTFHQDTPVIAPNMLESIWCAVKRQSKKGIIIGKDERISVYNALKGITINAAYQYFEEEYKGSIKEGKNADLIILEHNPCKINPDELRKLTILETIKDGNTVFKR